MFLDNLSASLQFFTASSPGEILWAVLSITMIDLVLSGDNAAVIALAVRGLPAQIKKKASAYGITIAIMLQVIFTLMATWLMTIPYLTAIGGVSLLIITWKLMTDHNYTAEREEREEKPEKNPVEKNQKSFSEALLFIILANLSMSFDNVLGVAGAAGGNYLLVFCSLLLSIPLLILGAGWLGKLMEAFPPVIFIGAGILAHTAIVMIFADAALGLGENIFPFSGNMVGWVVGLSIMIYGCTRKALPSPERRKES